MPGLSPALRWSQGFQLNFPVSRQVTTSFLRPWPLAINHSKGKFPSETVLEVMRKCPTPDTQTRGRVWQRPPKIEKQILLEMVASYCSLYIHIISLSRGALLLTHLLYLSSTFLDSDISIVSIVPHCGVLYLIIIVSHCHLCNFGQVCRNSGTMENRVKPRGSTSIKKTKASKC